MGASLSWKVVGHFVALMFAAAGALIIIHLPFPKPPDMDRWFLFGLGVVVIAAGAIVWHVPWERLPKWTLLGTCGPAALVFMASGSYFGKITGYYYGIHYVLIFIAAGIAYPRGTSIIAAIPASAIYVTPLIARGASAPDVWSVGWVIPVCAMVGETLSWVTGQLRRAQEVEAARAVDMASLVDATVVLARQEDPREVADLAARRGAQLLHGDGAIMLLMDRSGDFLGAGGFRWPAIAESVRIAPGAFAAVDLARATGTVVTDSADAPGLAAEHRFDAVLVLPVAGGEVPLGVLVIGYRQHSGHFDDFTLSVGGTFATQVGLALERLQAIRVLLNASLRDELTGLGNRRQVSKALELLQPGDAVVLIDLDFFKAFNDTLGHLAGDELLKRFGAFLVDSVREVDIVARYGGEEFLLVLPGVGEGGETVVQRIVADWRESTSVITFSAGVAVHPDSSSSAETLARADVALYEAKEAGRDCVKVHRRGITADKSITL